MHIILGIARHVIVDHQRYIIHIDSTCHNICSHQHIHFVVTEVQHYRVSLFLLQVAVHGAGVQSLPTKQNGKFLHALFLAGEQNHFLQSRLLEPVNHVRGLLRLVAV